MDAAHSDESETDTPVEEKPLYAAATHAIRLNIPLDKTHLENNVFSYPDLVRLHLSKAQTDLPSCETRVSLKEVEDAVAQRVSYEQPSKPKVLRTRTLSSDARV
jgi:hypothetical protein